MLYIGLIIAIMAGCFGLRGLAERKQKLQEEKRVGKSKIILTKLHNTGLAESRLEDRPETVKLLATIIVCIIAVIFLCTLPMREKKTRKLGLAFVLGGGLSNLLERYRYGYVTDYVKFDVPFPRIGRLVFNIADFCIFLGAIITAIASITE